MKKQFKQLGQGMTEYIIIVALIAITAIAAYGFFGDTLRSQLGGMAQELSGVDGTTAKGQSQTQAAATEAQGAAAGSLNTYDGRQSN